MVAQLNILRKYCS